MTATLHRLIEDRLAAAVDEGLEQLAHGWLPHEVAGVLEDAAAAIGDLATGNGVAAS